MVALTIAVSSVSVFSMATQSSAQTNQEMTQSVMTAMMQKDPASETAASAMNATDMMGGMSMLNINSMSMVDRVKVTGVNVESNYEISIDLKYSGNGSSPRITAAVMGITTAGMMSMDNSMLSGSNVLESGWESPSTMTIKLHDSATDDLTYIMVMVFPFCE